jgi:hypothetical protein
MAVQLGDLLLAYVDLLEGGGDLLEGEVALVPPKRDQASKLLQFGERCLRWDCP